ncbi:hypothetical protein RND59_19425 [Vibrio ruber]|uniref:hypothetical protein n=1 Tax=Vibrio ruber TaxID=184755 RepID=UPI002892A196|nr:hypothetical protein [Vibrio ruber]WNJ97372.1 hypothetical protein RND59_19425 [Vibrio ruber]
MKRNYLLLAIAGMASAFSCVVPADDTLPTPHFVKDMTDVLQSNLSYKVGDIDGDGIAEVVYLDQDNTIKAFKVAPAMNESVFNRLALTKWKLVDQRYGPDYSLSFFSDGKRVALNTSMRALDLKVDSSRNRISNAGSSSVGYITIEGITDTKIWGMLTDSHLDGQRAEPQPYEAVIK